MAEDASVDWCNVVICEVCCNDVSTPATDVGFSVVVSDTGPDDAASVNIVADVVPDVSADTIPSVTGVLFSVVSDVVAASDVDCGYGSALVKVVDGVSVVCSVATTLDDT